MGTVECIVEIDKDSMGRRINNGLIGKGGGIGVPLGTGTKRWLVVRNYAEVNERKYRFFFCQ